MVMTKLFAVALAFGVVACTHTSPPSSPQAAANLEAQSHATVHSMMASQPGLADLLNSSAGYAVFPNVGAAGFIAGGAYGNGVLFQGGQVVGYVDIKQASFGAQVGAKGYAELILLRSPYDVDRLKAGQFQLGGDVSAVVLTAGAAATGTLDPNTTVIVQAHGGLMAGISVQGQRIDFVPRRGGPVGAAQPVANPPAAKPPCEPAAQC
jgi:lipid-binding SYLF domain-containing protein